MSKITITFEDVDADSQSGKGLSMCIDIDPSLILSQMTLAESMATLAWAKIQEMHLIAVKAAGGETIVSKLQ